MDSNMSYVHTPGEFTYHYQTVPERMAVQAKVRGDRDVYVFLEPNGGRHSITANQVYERSIALAKALIKLGVKKGDIVATAVTNDADALVSILGAISSGAIVQNIMATKDDGTDIRDHLIKTNAACLILTPGKDIKNIGSYLKFIDEISPNGKASSKQIPSLKCFISTNAVDDHQFCLLGDLIKQKNACELPRLDPEDTIVLFSTSGSTGQPKLVPQSHHSAMVTGYHLKGSFNYDADVDVIYTERRFAWIGGFPYMYLHDGVKTVTKTFPIKSMTEHSKFTYDAMVREGCTIAGLIPPTVVGLLDVENNPNFLLKNIQTGGLPVSERCMDALGTISKMVTNVYGSSEAGFLSSNFVTNKKDYVNYSSGKPHRGVEMKIVDKDGFIVKRGEIGTLYARSPCLFRAYFNDKKNTESTLSSTHWMNTDDTGYIDEKGHVIISGRCSDLMLQGGKPFVPSSVEAIIKNHPDVLDVIVVAVPDAARFEIVTACVILKPGSTVTGEQIQDFLENTYLDSASEAFAKIFAELVLIFNEFPKLATGKPDKKKLKEEAVKRVAEMRNN